MEIESDYSTTNGTLKNITEVVTETPLDTFCEDMIKCLVKNDEVFFKSQQRNEQEIGAEEKFQIAKNIFQSNMCSFLLRFGKFLTLEQLDYFKTFKSEPDVEYELTFLLKDLYRYHSLHNKNKTVRNRRYAALKQMVQDGSYFSEVEMMKRNPLLYEQLVGKFLSEAEKKARDKHAAEIKSFVNVLMEGIERDDMGKKLKIQEDAEDAAMEESDSDTDVDTKITKRETLNSSPEFDQDQPSTSFLWGEINEQPKKRKSHATEHLIGIGAQERSLLKEEFVASMYESFLEGKDDDFDYETVDNSDNYDNIEILSRDEEDKYFDSEEPDDSVMEDDGDTKKRDESSEDELDIYMSALNNHPTVCQLSEDMKKL